LSRPRRSVPAAKPQRKGKAEAEGRPRGCSGNPRPRPKGGPAAKQRKPKADAEGGAPAAEAERKPKAGE
jgi:hypothetical protein